MKKFVAIVLCLMMVISIMPAAFAATVDEATIDTTKTASLTIYKYDFTNAHKDGVWNEDSFVSTGVRESYVEEVLGGATRDGNTDKTELLGDMQQTSNGYAIKGVEFSYLKVAEIVTFTESHNDGHDDYNLTQVLYGFDKRQAHYQTLLEAIGMSADDRYKNADNATDKLNPTEYDYYESDVINAKIAAALEKNSTAVKNALEAYLKANGGTAMPETDEDGMSTVDSLPLGLYLVVETRVPEMVTSTTDPFFVSLPMTTVTGGTDGNGADSSSPEGGHEWNYDVVLYPKNETGIPTLEKTLREAKEDTGKNDASDVINDGFAHTGTGSAGDVIEYQIISTLPTITSDATALTVWGWDDNISEGLRYNGFPTENSSDVKIEVFTDTACTDKVATWEAGREFTVKYGPAGRTMNVALTAAGLAEVNGYTFGENEHNGTLFAGYSNYTLRVTYSCTIVSDNNLVIGDSGNENTVALTWKRTNEAYMDMLHDDAHVYTYGIDLTKTFSDVEGVAAGDLFPHVKFKLWNKTDEYWVKASLNEAEGIYYVEDHVDTEEEATTFVPVELKKITNGGKDDNPYGHIMIKGLEDDEYVLTEIETADGYTLLKDDITIKIEAVDNPDNPCDWYTRQPKGGVYQNDPSYDEDGLINTDGLEFTNIPQKQLAHNHLTASGTVDGNAITMLSDNDSLNAEVPLTVRNTRGFTPPRTGDNSAQIMAMGGSVLAIAALGVILLLVFKRKKKEDAEVK